MAKIPLGSKHYKILHQYFMLLSQDGKENVVCKLAEEVECLEWILITSRITAKMMQLTNACLLQVY